MGSIASLLAAVGLCCALAMPAPAGAAWGPAQTVAASRSYYFYNPVLATNAKGDAVLLWGREEPIEEREPALEASTRRENGEWTKPLVIQGGSEWDLQAAIDARGNATAVWPEGLGGGGLWTTRKPAAGTWERATERAIGSAALQPLSRLVASPGGALALVYASSGDVELATREARGGWRPARILFHSAHESMEEPRLAVDGRGETIVAWTSDSERKRPRTRVLILGPSGRPEGPVQTLSSRRAGSRELSLNADKKGDAVLLWRGEGRFRRPIEVATRTFGKRFSRPVAVARNSDSEPVAAIEPDGDATILFTHALTTLPKKLRYEVSVQTSAVEVVTGDAGGHWTRPRRLASTPGLSTFEPRITAAPDVNEVIAAWTTADAREFPGGSETLQSPGAVSAAVRIADGNWQAPVVLSAQGSGRPVLAFSAGGKATAAWISQSWQEGPGEEQEWIATTTIKSAQYDP
jgi:hypothetical protein